MGQKDPMFDMQRFVSNLSAAIYAKHVARAFVALVQKHFLETRTTSTILPSASNSLNLSLYSAQVVWMSSLLHRGGCSGFGGWDQPRRRNCFDVPLAFESSVGFF